MPNHMHWTSFFLSVCYLLPGAPPQESYCTPASHTGLTYSAPNPDERVTPLRRTDTTDCTISLAKVDSNNLQVDNASVPDTMSHAFTIVAKTQ